MIGLPCSLKPRKKKQRPKNSQKTLKKKLKAALRRLMQPKKNGQLVLMHIIHTLKLRKIPGSRRGEKSNRRSFST